MLVESNKIWWAQTQKDIKLKCTTSTACMSSGKILKYQLPMTEKIRLPVLTKPGSEIKIDFSSKLHNKHVNDETYILMGIDRYCEWPVVRICKSTEAREVIKFLEIFMNLYGVPEKIKLDRGSAFIPNVYREFYRQFIESNIVHRSYTLEREQSTVHYNAKEVGQCQQRRLDRFQRERKQGSVSNAIYYTYRTQSEPI